MTTEFTLDFDAIFNDFITASKKAWGHDRTKSVGASEVFDCLRKVFFEKRGQELGFVPDDDYRDDWGALTRGNLIENHHVVPAIRDHLPEGTTALYTGDDQVTLMLNKASATPDGLITGLPKGCRLRIKGGTQDITIENIISDCIVLEIKSIDPRATLMEERAKHHGQTQMQLGLFHANTKHRPHYSIILYIDASFLSKMTPFVVKFDPAIYQEGVSRSEVPWQTDNPLDIIPEGRFSNVCMHCRWKTACNTAVVNSIPSYDTDPTATPETISAMDRLVTNLMQKKENVKTAEYEQEVAQEQIKEFLTGRNSKKMRGPTWSVTWYGQKGRKSLSKKMMEADGIDPEKYMTEGAPYDILKVTPLVEKTKKD